MDKIAERQASYKRYEKIRKKLGFKSDYQIVKETGIASATFSEWSRGTYEPKLEKKIKIAKVLGISLEQLVGA